MADSYTEMEGRPIPWKSSLIAGDVSGASGALDTAYSAAVELGSVVVAADGETSEVVQVDGGADLASADIEADVA